VEVEEVVAEVGFVVIVAMDDNDVEYYCCDDSY